MVDYSGREQDHIQRFPSISHGPEPVNSLDIPTQQAAQSVNMDPSFGKTIQVIFFALLLLKIDLIVFCVIQETLGFNSRALRLQLPSGSLGRWPPNNHPRLTSPLMADDSRAKSHFYLQNLH